MHHSSLRSFAPRCRRCHDLVRVGKQEDGLCRSCAGVRRDLRLMVIRARKMDQGLHPSMYDRHVLEECRRQGRPAPKGFREFTEPGNDRLVGLVLRGGRWV